ncbi:MAG: amidohydrolase family protein [Chitinophagaceae bacterium]|nr:amidohydrolase family protein [Chitinophagaceae bacterium]
MMTAPWPPVSTLLDPIRMRLSRCAARWDADHPSATLRRCFSIFFLLLTFQFIVAQQTDQYILLKPDRVFDGEKMQTGWVVLVKNNIIEQAGNMQFKLPAGTKVIELKGCTLLPGLIEGHSHLFLHPYNETSWDNQLLKESRAERTARAVNHAKATLMAGFTTVRDLGTEGAQYDDVGLKKAIEKGVIPGPRMICATRAIVATGSYGVKSDNPDIELIKGAAEVANGNELENEVRTQIAKGADVIKIYADYGWGRDGEARPTFTAEEIGMAVKIAQSSNREVVAHSSTPEGMLRSIRAGVSTIEHGEGGTEEVFNLMKEKNVALCPTLAATEATQQYKGWRKGIDPDTERIIAHKKSFKLALQAGVTICMGGDVGVFTHGNNAIEMELMAEYGMPAMDVLKSATSVNADTFGYGNKIGRIKKGLLADIIAVEGDPLADLKNIRRVKLVIKDGVVYKQ